MRHLSWRYAAAGFFALAALGGCATPAPPIPAYQPPAAGQPVAKLALRGYGADVYGTFYFADSQTCAQPQLMGNGRRNAEPPASVNLPAGQWSTVAFLAIDQVRKTQCRMVWSFHPVAGRTYMLSGMADATSCTSRIYDATHPDDMKLEASAVRRNVDGSRSCVSIADAQERKRKLAAANPAAGAKDEPMLAPSATTDDLKGLIGK